WPTVILVARGKPCSPREPGSSSQLVHDSRDDRVECFCQPAQVRQLGGRLRTGCLTETVDPDRRQAKLFGRGDVVEEAGGDVNVAGGVGARARGELTPVPE